MMKELVLLAGDPLTKLILHATLENVNCVR